MNLWEIFDFEGDVEWVARSWGQQGSVTLDGQPFSIQLRHQRLPELDTANIVEVSFFRTDIQGDEALASTNQTPYPGKVYGTVINQLAKKSKDHDAFYFTAEHRHSSTEGYQQRVGIYQTLAHRVSMRTGLQVYEKASPWNHEWLVSKMAPGGFAWKNEREEQRLECLRDRTTQ
jgi:hypothetical protein